MNNQRVLARVSRPVAQDAQGRAVDVRMSVEGDELWLELRHRDQDLAYPIVVDPEVVDAYVWDATAGRPPRSSNTGWTFGTSPGASGRFRGTSWPGYLGDGLYIEWTDLAFYNDGDMGAWYYRAPGTASIYKADWTYVECPRFPERV